MLYASCLFEAACRGTGSLLVSFAELVHIALSNVTSVAACNGVGIVGRVGVAGVEGRQPGEEVTEGGSSWLSDIRRLGVTR